MYRSLPNAKPINVSVGFNYGSEYDEKEMAHSHLANPGVTFYDNLPSIFFFIRLDAHEPDRAWLGGERGGYTVADVYEELALTIASKKNKLLAYRNNPPGIPIWLLIYTGVAASHTALRNGGSRLDLTA